MAKIEQCIQSYITGDDKPINVNFDLGEFEKKEAEKVLIETRDGDLYYRCTHCHTFKIASTFVQQRKAGCDECRSKRTLEYRKTPRGHLRQLIASSKKHTTTRNKNVTRKPTTAETTFEDLIEVFNLQGGRCAYSRMPLTFGNRDWACSLERQDVNIGYIRDNVLLICSEFQALDNSVKHKNPEDDVSSYGWTHQKFLTFIASARIKFGL